MSEISATGGTMTNMHIFLRSPNLKEYHVYLVKVSFSRNNPIHNSILQVGKKDFSDIRIFNVFYDRSYKLTEAYHIEIVQELCELKRR